MENLEGIKETKQLEQFHFTTFTVPVQCPVQRRMLPPKLQYNTNFPQQPKSGPLLQCTPGILMLGHFRTHQKPSQVLTLSAGMVPDVQTMARSGSQSLRLSPHHKTLCCVWTEPGKDERCQLPPKEKCSRTPHKTPVHSERQAHYRDQWANKGDTVCFSCAHRISRVRARQLSLILYLLFHKLSPGLLQRFKNCHKTWITSKLQHVHKEELSSEYLQLLAYHKV